MKKWQNATPARSNAWRAFLREPTVIASTSPPAARGSLSLAALPPALQREIRYGLHRHAGLAWRSQWRPASLQGVVDTLAAAQVCSLSDPAIAGLTDAEQDRVQRRIWLDLPRAARSLAVSAETSKEAGWFDPILVGAAPFPETEGNRRSPWDLTGVTQRWLRDLLWTHLHDEAIAPAGRRPTATTIGQRIGGMALLSVILHQTRQDHGNHPELLGNSGAQTVKQTWDLWLSERIPLPVTSSRARPRLLTERTRREFSSSIRVVLRQAREQGRTVAELDPFILSLPEYQKPPRRPRPRPLSYGDFQTLVSPENLRALDALDAENVGFSDIWLAQAFQGGRIGETVSMRLGCLGLVGAAQPYIWRDISKVGIIDYGMPCYLPVYERLLRRQEITRAKLRIRYRDELDQLDEHQRVKLESAWDRERPLFPRSGLNPDLKLAVVQGRFRDVWTVWFRALGLRSITTHQTRATLATSLLNNGAPAALVRQLLGHFSEAALAHYASYDSDTLTRHLHQVWAASPGTDKPGAILLRPTDITTDNPAAAAARIDLTVVPVEHGLCRYGPVVGGAHCPYQKNCTTGPQGPCEHFVLTGADLVYWERKRDAAYHFAEGAPTDDARDYILSQWSPWEPVLTGLREALDELGLLEAAEKLDLRTPVHDYFDPLFSTGWQVAQMDSREPTDTGREIEPA